MNKSKKLTSLSDFYTFEISAEKLQWKKFFILEAPGPRDSHSLVKMGDTLIMFGG